MSGVVAIIGYKMLKVDGSIPFENVTDIEMIDRLVNDIMK